MSVEQRNQKIQKLVEMGERAHLLARLGQLGDSELVAMSAQVTELDKVINSGLGKKAPIRESGICPQCNVAFEGSFCGGCGLNIDEFYSKPIVVCNACSFVMEAEDAFCGVCGSRKGE